SEIATEPIVGSIEQQPTCDDASRSAQTHADAQDTRLSQQATAPGTAAIVWRLASLGGGAVAVLRSLWGRGGALKIRDAGLRRLQCGLQRHRALHKQVQRIGLARTVRQDQGLGGEVLLVGTCSHQRLEELQ
ncbi:MAG: hypothetical protein RL522_1112, partial [Pseudomonadota bacterium]